MRSLSRTKKSGSQPPTAAHTGRIGVRNVTAPCVPTTQEKGSTSQKELGSLPISIGHTKSGTSASLLLDRNPLDPPSPIGCVRMPLCALFMSDVSRVRARPSLSSCQRLHVTVPWSRAVERADKTVCVKCRNKGQVEFLLLFVRSS